MILPGTDGTSDDGVIVCVCRRSAYAATRLAKSCATPLAAYAAAEQTRLARTVVPA
jgi:hypothetical protein